MLLLRNFITAAIQRTWSIASIVNREIVGASQETLPAAQGTEEQGIIQDIQGMHMLDVVCVEEGEYYTIDKWFSELGIAFGSEGVSLRALAKHIGISTGGMLYDFFAEMKEHGFITSSNNASLDVARLKELLQHKSLHYPNPYPDQGTTPWNIHVLDVVRVEIGKYTTVDNFYFDFVEKGNVGEGLNDEFNLRTLAKHIGIGTGGVLYNFIMNMDDPKSVMPPELVLDCFDIVKLANSLQPSPKMASRFWEWFLGGVDSYLWNSRDRNARIKEMLSKIVKEKSLKGVSELETKRNGGPVSAIEILYCLEKFIFEFTHLKPANPSVQEKINALVLYYMVTTSSLGRIAKNFKHLISSPFENSNLLKIDTFDGDRRTKVSPEYSDTYRLYIDKSDLDSLKNNIIITSFWDVVRRQVLSLGFRILEPVINISNNSKKINIREDLAIIYDVAGITENDALTFSTSATDNDWGKVLVECGFSGISRVSISVFDWYAALAVHFPVQFKYHKAVRELELVFRKKWDDDLSKGIAKLKGEIESIVKNCNLILGTRVVNPHSIKCISEIEPHGVTLRNSFGLPFGWDPICDSIKGMQWKDMRFDLFNDYNKFMATLKGVKQEIEEANWESKQIGEHKWKLERLSLQLDTPHPVTLIGLVRDTKDIMPYARSLFIRGVWDRIPTPDEKGIANFKKIKYFECSYKNRSYLEPTPEDKLQSITLDSAGEAYTPSLKELAVYKMALDKEGADYLASLPLRKLYLHTCPTSREPSLLPIILNLKSELAKFLKHLTILYWYPTPEDETAGYDFIKAKEKEGVFVSIRYMK